MATKRNKGTAYIAGPMTNIPKFNFPAFDAVAAHARAEGYDVSNPHEHDQEVYPAIDEAAATQVGDVLALAEEVGFSFEGAMTWDLSEVIRTNHIILLEGWENSTGARFERAVAEATGSTILLAVPPEGFDGDESDPYPVVLVEDHDQKRVTTHLAGFSRPTVTAEDATPRELLTALQAKLDHVPGMKGSLERIGAQLA